jgi:glycine dehydrogenase subunit 2
MKHETRKAARHVNQNEGLIFEKSSAGKAAWKLPPLDVPEVDPATLLGTAARKDLGNMPEVSEIEIIRHFTRLSTWNYAIDLGMYPLGSCTMKYNPRVNEAVARVEGIANGHPYQPEKISQGAMQILKTLSECLIEITGMDAITLQPAAGAHGEMTGLLMVRAYHHAQGRPRKKVLIPDSAHGTNPATAAMVDYAVENLKSDSRGMVDIAALEAQMSEDVAALMLTNPNTLGVFEQEIHKIADILHAKGGLLYMDGANMNALVGKVRPGDFGVDVMHLNLHKTFSTPHGGGGPGSGPVAVKKKIEPFLPTPVLVRTARTEGPGTTGLAGQVPETTGQLHWNYDRPQSVGRVRAFYGNTGMFIRALAYILANGPDGLRQTTEDAVLNANYIRAKLEDLYELPYKTASMHEVVFSDKRQAAKGVRTGDIAKRLIDYGFHPYTVSFPMIVHGALMIEPTESESLEELDLFVDAMRSIAKEVDETPELVKTAPHSTRVGRLDEVQAARKPILRWRPSQ